MRSAANNLKTRQARQRQASKLHRQDTQATINQNGAHGYLKCLTILYFTK